MLKTIFTGLLLGTSIESLHCMEDQAAHFNDHSGTKRKLEREQNNESKSISEEPNSEPEKKRQKTDLQGDYAQSLEFPDIELLGKAESGDKESIIQVYKALKNLRNLKWTKKAAEQGHLSAQRRLATDRGKEGYYWCIEAAKQGHPRDIKELGWKHEKGEGCKVDYHKAFELYTTAFEKGCNWGEFMRGRLYQKGLGVAANPQKAFECYLRAIEEDSDPKTMKKIGDLYLQGTGVAKDINKAIEWYTKAATNVGRPNGRPNSRAAYQLAQIYHHGLEGITKDLKKAAQFYFQAEIGHKEDGLVLCNIFEFLTNYRDSQENTFSNIFRDEMNKLEHNLSMLRDDYILKEAMSGGRFTDTLHNPGLQTIAIAVHTACTNYLHVLEMLEKPGFLINCLEISPDIKGNHNLFDLHHTIGNETYWSFYPDNLELLQKNMLAELLKGEHQQNEAAIRTIKVALQQDMALNDLNMYVKGMAAVGQYSEGGPSFLSAYLASYFETEETLEGKRAYLNNLVNDIEEKQKQVEESLVLANAIFQSLLGIIEKTVDTRNYIFSDETGWDAANN